MKTKKKFLFFLLCLVSSAFVLASVSCGKRANEGGNKDFIVKEIKIWGRDVLDANKAPKPRLTVAPNETNDNLKVVVENAAKGFDVLASIGGQTFEGSTKGGVVTIKIEKLPVVEDILDIVVSAEGFNNKSFPITIKREDSSAPGLAIAFIPEGGDAVPIQSEGQEVYSEQQTAKIKISSPKFPMETLKIEDSDISLTDENSKEYTHVLSGITADRSVPIAITYKNHKSVNRTFNLKKVEPGQMPLVIVGAKISHGDDYGDSETLSFNSSDVAEVALNKIKYSTVKLEVLFNQAVTSREIEVLEGNRKIPAGANDDFEGKYAGYVVADVQGIKETQLTPINGKKYTEEFIVGIAGASFKIKVKGNSDKEKEFQVKIENTTNAPEHEESDEGGLGVYNGLSGLPLFATTGSHLFLPHYSKGPLFNADDGYKIYADGYKDLAYVDKVAISYQDFDRTPFWVYYNTFKDTDKHEFKRVKSKARDTFTQAFVVADPGEQGQFDMLLAWEKEAPLPLFPLYYSEKFKKLDKPNKLFLLRLENDKKFKFSDKSPKENVSTRIIFGFIFNYRIQTQHYTKQTDESTNPLIIAKQQKYKWYDLNDERSLWIPFVKADGTDQFLFSPSGFFDPKDIKEVKHTIKTGDDKDNCSTGSCITAKTPKKTTDGDYILGTDSEGTETVKFEDNKVYKVYVKVKDQSDKEDHYLYIIDFKNEQTLNLMGAGIDIPDTDSDLFGVPTHYAKAKMKMLDPKYLRALYE